jgi:hypothetical protein
MNKIFWWRLKSEVIKTWLQQTRENSKKELTKLKTQNIDIHKQNESTSFHIVTKIDFTSKLQIIHETFIFSENSKVSNKLNMKLMWFNFVTMKPICVHLKIYIRFNFSSIHYWIYINLHSPHVRVYIW